MSRGKFWRIQKDHYCIVGYSQIKFILSENVCEVSTNFCSKLKQQNKKSYDLDLFLALDLSGIVNLKFFLIPLWLIYEIFQNNGKNQFSFFGSNSTFGLLNRAELYEIFMENLVHVSFSKQLGLYVPVLTKFFRLSIIPHQNKLL